MNQWSTQLGPEHLGAEVLVTVARQRATCDFIYDDGQRRTSLLFIAGRPQTVSAAGGEISADKQAVTSAVHQIAVATAGQCHFASRELAEVANQETLRVDTIGEILVALFTYLDPVKLQTLGDVRGSVVVAPTELFERLLQVLAKLRRVTLRMPSCPQPFGKLLLGGDVNTQCAWVAMLVLGGLAETAAAPLQPSATGRAPGAILTPPQSPPQFPGQQVPPPVPSDVTDTSEAVVSAVDTEASRQAQMLRDAHRELAGATHYDVLGIPSDANDGAINKAFLARAKSRHSDRFAGIDIGDAAIFAEELFAMAELAQQILLNQDERSNYDFVLDREAKGLPTDPEIIFKAEDLFRRAKAIIKRGNPAGAEPLLQEAVSLNRGEPEFWSYLGYAIYCARGNDAISEVKEAFQHAQAGTQELDSVYDFQGKIARVEGDLSTAKARFRKALELNPENVEAERELRLITMRTDDRRPTTDDDGSLVGKLRGLFKR